MFSFQATFAYCVTIEILQLNGRRMDHFSLHRGLPHSYVSGGFPPPNFAAFGICKAWAALFNGQHEFICELPALPGAGRQNGFPQWPVAYLGTWYDITTARAGPQALIRRRRKF